MYWDRGSARARRGKNKKRIFCSVELAGKHGAWLQWQPKMHAKHCVWTCEARLELPGVSHGDCSCRLHCVPLEDPHPNIYCGCKPCTPHIPKAMSRHHHTSSTRRPAKVSLHPHPTRSRTLGFPTIDDARPLYPSSSLARAEHWQRLASVDLDHTLGWTQA
jgi:hypothetical protein